MQRAQAMLGARLLEHMREKLLKGERVAQQTAHRQRLERLLLEVDVQATSLSISLDAHMMAHQFARDVIALEINAQHAMTVDFALHMQAIQLVKPAIGINRARQRG